MENQDGFTPEQSGADRFDENGNPQTSQNNGGPQNNGFAITGMVLGIVSIVTACSPLIGIATGIVGLVFSIKANTEGVKSGMVKAGIICSIIGTALAAINGIAGAIMAVTGLMTLPF